MKLYGTVAVQLLTFIIQVLDEVNGVVHMLATLPSAKAAPRHRIEGWVDFRPTLDNGHNIKIFVSTSNLTSISRLSSSYIILSLCSLSCFCCWGLIVYPVVTWTKFWIHEETCHNMNAFMCVDTWLNMIHLNNFSSWGLSLYRIYIFLFSYVVGKSKNV